MGVLYMDRCNLTVENCTFENLFSNSGSAINFKGVNLIVKDSKFINSNVSSAGGSIIAKFFPKKWSYRRFIIN